MKPGETKPGMVMIVEMTEKKLFGDQVLRYTARPAAFNADGEMRLAGSYSIDLPTELDGFVISAQRFRYKCDNSVDGSMYWSSDLYHDVSRIDLARAEAIVKRLRAVNRRVEALTARFGAPRDVAAYTAYIANGLGMVADRPFLRRVEAAQDYNGTGYHAMSAEWLADWVRRQESDWLKKYAPSQAA